MVENNLAKEQTAIRKDTSVSNVIHEKKKGELYLTLIDIDRIPYDRFSSNMGDNGWTRSTKQNKLIKRVYNNVEGRIVVNV